MPEEEDFTPFLSYTITMGEKAAQMTNLYDSLIEIPWFRPERYDDARRHMADASFLPNRYDIWLERAEQREHQARSSGAAPKRVYVDDDRFISCARKNLVLDRKSRARYAADFCAQIAKANIADYTNPHFWLGPFPVTWCAARSSGWIASSMPQPAND